MSRKVSYGQTEDEYIEIHSLSDEIKFKMCMKLYKLFPTVEDLETAIVPEVLVEIENIR